MEWSHALPAVVGEGAALRLLRRRRRGKAFFGLVGVRQRFFIRLLWRWGESSLSIVSHSPPSWPAGSRSPVDRADMGPFFPYLGLHLGWIFVDSSIVCLVGWPVCLASPSCLVTETEGGLEVEERGRTRLARRAHGVVG
jgi:hypothetical protein